MYDDPAAQFSPKQLRDQVRSGEWSKPTTGCCTGFVQANVVVVPEAHSREFLEFCERNPRPCPLLEMTSPGGFSSHTFAPGADLRTDVPKYRTYRNGKLHEESLDVRHTWRDDLVAFLLGCSFTFESALEQAGIPLRHVQQGKNVSMYKTNLSCQTAGPFSGPLVVSMRPVPGHLVTQTVEITTRFPSAHGAPVHAGDPNEIGITDLARPDFGDAVSIRPDDVPVFWACGVTPQAAALNARLDLMITQAPGHMFVTDVWYEDVAGG
jgi:uncharacterized protein YcsI (UPF0317 family)